MRPVHTKYKHSAIMLNVGILSGKLYICPNGHLLRRLSMNVRSRAVVSFGERSVDV